MRWNGKNSVNLRIIKALAPNTRKHWHQTLVATVCATAVGDGVTIRWSRRQEVLSIALPKL